MVDDTRQREDERTIICENALNGHWLPLPEEFHSGDIMGFTVAGVCVRAKVSFDKYGVVVNMLSPIECTGRKDIFFRHQGFFRRNPPGASLFVDGKEGGAATEKCLLEAKTILMGLYADWAILYGRKEIIRSKVSGFGEYSAAYIEKERHRTAPYRQRINELSTISCALKQRLKNGEINQEEYVRERQPIHQEITSLLKEAQKRDPFTARFSQEINDCHYVEDKKSFIENI